MVETLFYQYLKSDSNRYTKIKLFEDGDIGFSNQGLNFLFSSDPKNDPYYFRIMLPNVEGLSTTSEKVRRKIDRLNNHIKLARAIVVDENSVWIVVDAFAYYLDNNILLYQLFDRMIGILHDSIEMYHNTNE